MVTTCSIAAISEVDSGRQWPSLVARQDEDTGVDDSCCEHWPVSAGDAMNAAMLREWPECISQSGCGPVAWAQCMVGCLPCYQTAHMGVILMQFITADSGVAGAQCILLIMARLTGPAASGPVLPSRTDNQLTS